MHRTILALVLACWSTAVSAHEIYFQRPVDPSVNTCRSFGRQIDDRHGNPVLHAGRDYCGARGAAIYAAGTGRVVFAAGGDNHGLGSTVIIEHTLDRISGASNSIYTLYGHLDSFSVAVGDWVRGGQPIGTLGQTGSGSNEIDHLHFEVKTAGLLEAPDPDDLSPIKEYGYTALHPSRMGYAHPDQFLGNPVWRNLHIHSTQNRAAGRILIEGEFGAAGTVTRDTGTGAQPLSSVTWQPDRINFNIFQGEFTFDNFVQPISITVSPTNLPALGKSSFPFQDVERSDWYSRYAVGSWKKGFLNGESGLFLPARGTSFSEFIKLLVEVSPDLEPIPCIQGERPVGTFTVAEFPPFSAGNPWYCSYFKALVQRGWMDEFLTLASHRGRPTQPIQRQEAAFFLSRTLPAVESSQGGDFPDVQSDNLFREDIRRCAVSGIFHGYTDGTFGPAREITRAEAVKVFELAFYPDQY